MTGATEHGAETARAGDVKALKAGERNPRTSYSDRVEICRPGAGVMT